MSALQRMFPSLTTFSDLNWEAVTAEYESEYIDLSFPEYLQQKAADGDCPPYLFEIAYYEMALFEAKTSEEKFPYQDGVYLNPTALFLSLEFDVVKMIEEAKAGNIGVIEKEHCLCIFKNRQSEVKAVNLSEEELKVLQLLEDGPLKDKSVLKKKNVSELIKQEIIFDLA